MSLDAINLLDLPPEIIQNSIAPHLSPKDNLTARLVCKYFSGLFGEDYVWHSNYKSLGLGRPIVPPNKIGKLTPSSLFKTLPIWTSFQKIIENMNEQGSTDLCIMASLLPELSPLHSYAIEVLKKQHNSPEKFSVEELYLRVAKKELLLRKAIRILVLKSLSKIKIDSKTIQQIYLSVIKETQQSDSDEFLRIAIKGLLPFQENIEIQKSILTTIKYHGTKVLPKSFNIATNPEMILTVFKPFNRRLYDLDNFQVSLLNNPYIVNSLVQTLITTIHDHLILKLIRVLKLAINQIPVQDAFCQKISEIKGKLKNSYKKFKLFEVIYNAELNDEIIQKYKKKIPALKKFAKAKKILQLTPSTSKDQKPLLKYLSNNNRFIRTAAANTLAPFVPNKPEILSAFLKLIDVNAHEEMAIIAANALVPLVRSNPEILKAFLKRIDAQIFDRAAIVIINGLAEVADQKDIRIKLIQKGYVTEEASSLLTKSKSKIRLAAIQTLQPFLDEPEVREIFFQCTYRETCLSIDNKLLDILSSQLDKEDVRTLFLEIAKEPKIVHHPHYYLSQIAAIDKLGSIANVPKVRTVLNQLLKTSHPSLKAACIRALCSNRNWRLIDPIKLFIFSIDDSKKVRKAARDALISWTYEEIS